MGPKRALARGAAALLMVGGSLMALGCALTAGNNSFFLNVFVLSLVVYSPYFLSWWLLRWAEESQYRNRVNRHRVAPVVAWVLGGIAFLTTMGGLGFKGLLVPLAAYGVWKFRDSPIKLIPSSAVSTASRAPASGSGLGGLWRRAGQRLDGSRNPLLQAVVMIVVELPESLSSRR